MTTKTTAKTPLHGLTSCGNCGAPMRHVEATGDHEAMYVCYRKHRPRTTVRLDAHVTDRLVIGGVLARRTLRHGHRRHAARTHGTRGAGRRGRRPPGRGPGSRQGGPLSLPPSGRRQGERPRPAGHVRRAHPALPGPGGRPLPHAVAVPQPPRRGDGTGDPILPQHSSLTRRVQAGPSVLSASAP